MTNFNLGRFITSFVGYTVSNLTGRNATPAKTMQSGATSNANFVQNATPQANFAGGMVAFKGGGLPFLQMQNYQMNNLALLEKSLYFKNAMNFPKEMNEVVTFIQQNLQNSSAELLKSTVETNLLNLNQLAQIFQSNGKEALAKLINDMASASKQGMNDVSQLKDLMKLINASVATAEQNNPAQNVKTLMLLYLPWLPLQAETGYDLEVETSDDKKVASDECLTVLISTEHFGNLKCVIMLGEDNSVLLSVECIKDFPQDELKIALQTEAKHSSLKLEVSFSNIETKKDEEAKTNVKILMPNSNNINQYLVLTAHLLVKLVISIDKNC